MEILEAMKNRHSVRQYLERPIEPEKRAILNELAANINKENNLHIQIIYDDSKCFDSMLARYGKFLGVKNYIALVGQKSATLDETLGYFGEQLAIKAQTIGLNTCWVAMSHGKSKAEIRKGEKQVCLIALGYGRTDGVTHQSKALHEVCNYNSEMPEWFINGIKASLLAPTAMNQQKFFFKLSTEGNVDAVCGKGFYTKLDLGIVKYHFEIGSGKKI